MQTRLAYVAQINDQPGAPERAAPRSAAPHWFVEGRRRPLHRALELPYT
ncbi:MAG TPA: hypothetical protein VEE84_00230 [Burkholderiaceae bacterium]|nr:hypothetical protein [Burkholderiaceae bacterium]